LATTLAEAVDTADLSVVAGFVQRCVRPLLLLLAFTGAAQAAPFSYDPVSFAGYANQVFKTKGERLFVRNLGTCLREGKDRTGYRCLSGELLQDLPAKRGRNFCRVDAIWYVPLSKTVQVRTVACQFKADQQRMIEAGQQLLRQGLEQLENTSR
jgi:hypothetical protein